jgi:HemY protein
MWRVLLLILLIVAGGLGFVWLDQVPGMLEMRLDQPPGGGEPVTISMTPVYAVAGVLVLAVALTLVLQILSFLWSLPGKIGKRIRQANQNRAREAFVVGLLAHQGGDHRRALKLSQKAAQHADDRRLPLWLQAQAAVATDDLATAERAYTALSEERDAALAGLKGLSEVALAKGDQAAARRAADKAFALPVKAEWAYKSAFELAVASGDWPEAMRVLQTAVKARLIGADPARRRRAVLLTAEADRLSGADDKRAEKLAVDAATLAPSLTPAVYLAARLLAQRGQPAKAEQMIEQTWATRAHPALGALYADVRGVTGSTTRAARFRKLAAIRSEQRESRYLEADAALLTGDWQAAEDALKAILEEAVTSRACALMSDVMRGSGRADTATMWAARAAGSPREGDWSDLELDGRAFVYTEAEWARLVYVFGDAGQLIHPRQESQARDLPANALLGTPGGRPSLIAQERTADSITQGLLPAALTGPLSGRSSASRSDAQRPPPDYADEDYGY